MLNPKTLRQVIVDSGVSFRENAVSYIFTCPRCEKPKKLAIHKLKGYFRCHRCVDENDFKGKNPEYALVELLEKSLQEIKQQLYGDSNVQATEYIKLDLQNHYSSESGNQIIEESLSEVAWNPEFVDETHPMFIKGANYLLDKRGLRQEHIDVYQIKYHPAWKSVVFPVIVNEKLVGWQERGIDSDFKYTLQGFRKDKTLMFHDRLLTCNHAVLTEGPVDALKCHILGGNVCSMGKGVSIDQLNIIKKHVKKLYLGLDPDASTEIDKICRYMSDDVEIYLLPPPKGRKDLGASTEEEVVEQYERATPYYGQCFIYLKGNE